jgi:hypothetical protein
LNQFARGVSFAGNKQGKNEGKEKKSDEKEKEQTALSIVQDFETPLEFELSKRLQQNWEVRRTFSLFILITPPDYIIAPRTF